MFAFAYAGVAFAAVTALFFAAAQWSIDQAPWALWALPVCGAAAISLYFCSWAGQRLAAAEIEAFRRLLGEALGRTTEETPLRPSAKNSGTT